MRTSYSKKIIVFFITLFLVGFVLGILYTLFNKGASSYILEYLNNFIADIKNYNVNNILNHQIILLVIFFSSFIFVGVLLSIVFVFYNGFVLGFLMSIFLINFGFQGLIFSFIFIIFTRGLFLFLLLIIVNSIFKLSLYFFRRMIKKENIFDSYTLLLIKKIYVIIIFILINDIVIYYLSPYVINIFKFLII